MALATVALEKRPSWLVAEVTCKYEDSWNADDVGASEDQPLELLVARCLWFVGLLLAAYYGTGYGYGCDYDCGVGYGCEL